MTNATDKTYKVLLTGFCCLILISITTGNTSIEFDLTDIKCSHGIIYLRMECNVPYPDKGIKIFKNDRRFAYCVQQIMFPFFYCEKKHPHNEPSNSSLVNTTLIYNIETANADLIAGTWICRNGAENDPRSNISVPNITCALEMKPIDGVPRSAASDGKGTTGWICILLMLVPIGACIAHVFLLLSSKTERLFYSISFFVYSVFASIIFTIEIENDARIALTVVCCLIGICFLIIIPVKWTLNKRKSTADKSKGNKPPLIISNIKGNTTMDSPDRTTQRQVDESPNGENQTTAQSDMEGIAENRNAQRQVDESPNGENQTTAQSGMEAQYQVDESPNGENQTTAQSDIEEPNELDRLISEQ